LSVQGGIGTSHEDTFLKSYYPITSTGWGTPFLLVPEATTVDEDTLQLLCNAKQADIELSHNSPLGVRFHYLKGTTSHKEKLARINNGKPGSPCTEKHLGFNTEFTKEPICTASYKYIKLKTAQLQSQQLPAVEYQKQIARVHDKECLCVGLSNPAATRYGITFVNKLHATTVCPGPNIAYFSKQVSLQTMTDHIYGRTNIISAVDRPHMFIGELHLYLKYLHEQLTEECNGELTPKQQKRYAAFITNMRSGIAYYKALPPASVENETAFHVQLDNALHQLGELQLQYGL
jgi:hypothetical protein